MDEPFLVVISLTMFMGSYLAGCIPLFFTLDEKRIRVVSMLGAGLLIGTALCVIIPEGVSTLVDSVQDQKIMSHDLERIQSQNDVKKSKLLTENGKKQRINRDQRDLNLELKQTSSMVPGSSEGMSPHYQQFTKEKKNLLKRETLKKGENTKSIAENINEKEEAQNLDHSIGIPLLIGFLFMFVVDQISKMSHSRHKSLSTLGLVIHSFSDGIAMGSAAGAGSQTEMQILVFIAIMLHKAPAAFALVSILLSHGLEKVRIRRHLLVFSLAAPIATILTYAFLHTAQYEEDPSAFEGPKNAQGNSSSQLTGLILLFSAGTFLYVATVHVLPELIESKCSMSAGGGSGSRELLLMGGCGGNGVSTANSRLNLFEMLLFCISAMVPAFISFFNHGHGHK